MNRKETILVSTILLATFISGAFATPSITQVLITKKGLDLFGLRPGKYLLGGVPERILIFMLLHSSIPRSTAHGKKEFFFPDGERTFDAGVHAQSLEILPVFR